MRKLLVLSSVLILSMSLFAMGNMKNTKSTANNCTDKAKSCCQQTTTNNNCNCCCCGVPATTTTTGSAIKK